MAELLTFPSQWPFAFPGFLGHVTVNLVRIHTQSFPRRIGIHFCCLFMRCIFICTRAQWTAFDSLMGRANCFCLCGYYVLGFAAGKKRIILIFNHLQSSSAPGWGCKCVCTGRRNIEFISNHRLFKPITYFRPPAHEGQIRGDTRVNFRWNSTETLHWKHYWMHWAEMTVI